MNDDRPMSLNDAYPPQSLRDYAFLADGHRGALIGPRGDVSWLCAPRWDSPAMFSQLIGGRGTFAITPVETFVWGGYYEPGTLVWVSRWTTTDCRVQCHEALAVPSDPHRLVLLRHLEAGGRPSSVDVILDVCAEFGTKRSSARRDESGCWVIEAGELYCRLSGAGNAQRASICPPDRSTTWSLRSATGPWTTSHPSRLQRPGRPPATTGRRPCRSSTSQLRHATPATPTPCCAA